MRLLGNNTFFPAWFIFADEPLFTQEIHTNLLRALISKPENMQANIPFPFILVFSVTKTNAKGKQPICIE